MPTGIGHEMFQEGNSEALEQDRIENLRVILETEQGLPISYDEAQEVGETLLSFYEVLGSDSEVSQEIAV
jgi:hypothetical protein